LLPLTNSQQVYQIVRKIIDDQPENGRIRLSVPAIYDTIKKSNSSLNRKPKRLIEDSLERVLEVVKADMGEEDEDSMEGDFEGLEEPAATVRYALRLFCPNGTEVLISIAISGTQWNEPERRRLMGNNEGQKD
jgi:hypothetical protein